MLKPLEKMWARVDNDRTDSDTAFFFGLLNLGELVFKFSVAGMIAAIQDDKSRIRYRHEHTLVRANGIGDWGRTLDEVLTGPASQIILPDARVEQRALTERVGKDSWQFRAASELNSVLVRLDASTPPLAERLDGRRWFHLFAQLRNKTRGHGAQGSGLLAELCHPLEKSLHAFVDNFSLFAREWAYLHRNLSGKYRVSVMSHSAPAFEYLKKTTTENLRDGVYVFFAQPALVELACSDADLADFYLPNGGFTDSQYEMLSYITGDRTLLPSAPFLIPPDLPRSHTEGLGNLKEEGECFTNLPPQAKDYVSRPELQKETRVIVKCCGLGGHDQAASPVRLSVD